MCVKAECATSLSKHCSQESSCYACMASFPSSGTWASMEGSGADQTPCSVFMILDKLRIYISWARL